jgi:hypothetical protein
MRRRRGRVSPLSLLAWTKSGGRDRPPFSWRHVPVDLAAQVTVPTLVMSGGASLPFMQETAETLGNMIPNTRVRSLEGQTHAVESQVLAPVLVEFIDFTERTA